MRPGDAPQVLYRMFDQDDTLLYVGITAAPKERFAAHQAEKEWWPEVARIAQEHFATRREVEVAERLAIIAEQPLYNRTRWASYVKTAPDGKPLLPPASELAASDAAIEARLTRVRTELMPQIQAIRQDRQNAVLEARAAGWSKYRIAGVLGVAGPTVDSIVKTARKEQQ